MRAKFYCNSVEDFGGQKQANLSPVTNGSKEDDDFNEFTPCGSLNMTISAKGAMNYFVPGKRYYLDFSEAPDEL